MPRHRGPGRTRRDPTAPCPVHMTAGPRLAVILAVQLSRRSGAEVEAQQHLHLGSLMDFGNGRTSSSPSQARPEAENPGHCSRERGCSTAASDTSRVWITRRPCVTLESENLSDSCPIPSESRPHPGPLMLTKPLLSSAGTVFQRTVILTRIWGSDDSLVQLPQAPVS